MSFLGLEGLHIFVTGAAGGIGGQAVQEFLGMYVFASSSRQALTDKEFLQIKVAKSQPTTASQAY